MLKMEILDDAFAADIHSVEDIFRRESPPRRSLTLNFKKDKFNVPICRQPISTCSEMTTHSMKPLMYHTYLYYQQRLNLSVRMVRAMKPYDLRRGIGEAGDSEYLCISHNNFSALTMCAETASLPLLQQVIGHIYASTSQKYEWTSSDPYSSLVPRNPFRRYINEHP